MDSLRVNRTVAIITVSDSGARGEREDASGAVLAERLTQAGFEVRFRSLVPDEAAEIAERLRYYADEAHVALLVTTGGTGVAPRDVTPEATLSVAERIVPGMAEAMRAASLAKTPHAMLSRGIVAIRGVTLVVNLPGSPRGAAENLEAILPALPHAIEKIQGDTRPCAMGA